MTDTLSYGSIRAANVVRESDEQRNENRKKSLLILVLQYLFDEGYIETAGSLEKEANINLNRFEVCDNVNLETVLLDFESYYHVKFNRYPKIFKKLNAEKEKIVRPPGKSCPSKKPIIPPPHQLKKTPSLPKLNQNNGHPNYEGNIHSNNHTAAGKQNTMAPKKSPIMNGQPSQEDMTLHGNIVNQNNSNSKNCFKGGKQIIDIRSMISDATKLPCSDENPEDRLLKPLGGYMGYSAEWKELAQVISRDIYSQNPNVYWKDIIGLDDAKRLAKESVVYPIKYPQLFTGILSPWKGLLLYGPPGTGKTLLAKAVATECKTTFFNISASSIVSKWRGDSEKLVRVLFELARFHAPSTIFLDEIDAIMGQRGASGGGEHEGSRRMKTELLVQMDGLSKSDDLVFLLAASNLPWELDPAMLRRLEKRILVDLPSFEARKAMFYSSLPPIVCSPDTNTIELTSDLDYNKLAQLTEGYSGSDIRLVCKEAAMRPVRKIFEALENLAEGEDANIKLDTITTADALKALSKTKSSASGVACKYIEWQNEFESV